ncbi:hypothetical protein JTB14_036141 [Gonioctena quinquepunctata]|nr:hypothetical protein JTB14_036141 [Gonioctena quinquepunctata]
MNIVVDGRFLLHRVIWRRDASIATICDRYITYVNHQYPGEKCTVVFDGYLSNPTNESRVIFSLQIKLEENALQTLQVTDKADVLIVKTAVEQSPHSSVGCGPCAPTYSFHSPHPGHPAAENRLRKD